MLEFTTEKGIHFRHGLSEHDVPNTCKMNVPIQNDEYILGFYGNLSTALDGFGIYIGYVPIISRRDMINCKSAREPPHSFDNKIFNSCQTMNSFTVATRDIDRGIELISVMASCSNHKVSGYNACGENFSNAEDVDDL